jgi:hypothetical protein
MSALFLKWRYIHAENVYISESELNTNSGHWHVGWYHCFAKHPVSFHDGRTKEQQQVLHCSLSGNKAYVGEHPQVLLTFPVASSVISGSEFFNHAAIAWEKRESWSKSTFIRKESKLKTLDSDPIMNWTLIKSQVWNLIRLCNTVLNKVMMCGSQWNTFASLVMIILKSSSFYVVLGLFLL